jgi:hypothetical protein
MVNDWENEKSEFKWQMAKGKWQMAKHLNFAPASRDRWPFDLFLLSRSPDQN